jgi:hypothetical protein
MNIRGIGVVLSGPRDLLLCNMLISIKQYHFEAVWPFRFVNQDVCSSPWFGEEIDTIDNWQ